MGELVTSSAAGSAGAATQLRGNSAARFAYAPGLPPHHPFPPSLRPPLGWDRNAAPPAWHPPMRHFLSKRLGRRLPAQRLAAAKAPARPCRTAAQLGRQRAFPCAPHCRTPSSGAGSNRPPPPRRWPRRRRPSEREREQRQQQTPLAAQPRNAARPPGGCHARDTPLGTSSRRGFARLPDGVSEWRVTPAGRRRAPTRGTGRAGWRPRPARRKRSQECLGRSRRPCKPADGRRFLT
jgi:hypothetical protein